MTEDQKAPSGKVLGGLALAALGVVYGDIGTSPLYALKECFNGAHAVPLSPENVLGVLSLVFWSLNFVISFKYIAMVLRADNRGEGGILALLALVRPRGRAGHRREFLLMLGLFGAALLYGDGMITPAISVLAAVEGLAVHHGSAGQLQLASPAFQHWVIPITIGILTALFWLQKRGTASVGRMFGPLMVIWFGCLAGLGIHGIVQHPGVVAALNPAHAWWYLQRNGFRTVFVLGAVFLVLTGGEALYADMGHIGRRPIRIAWWSVVLPALMLNYMGQGAVLLTQGQAAVINPFYSVVPSWGLYPMVVIATMAATIASQALISGAFSLTQQAMQLGFVPRMRLIHTSRTYIGQIYLPGINWTLWLGTVSLVLAFQTSDALASTYGVAVTGTMLITTILLAVVEYRIWHWPLPGVVALSALFLVVDLAFFGANMVKFVEGGWFPLAAGAVIYLLMSTWRRGRQLVTAIMTETSLPLELFIPDIVKRKPPRVPGVAVFMTSIPDVAPPVLLHHLKHNKVLHEKVLLMTLASKEIPQVGDGERVAVEARGAGLFQVKVRYGFMESPNVPAILEAISMQLHEPGEAPPPLRLHDITFYLGRETLIVPPRHMGAERAAGTMPAWRAELFAVMSRNAISAASFFGLPPNRVVELGAQIQV
ncbi:MAG: potassium transporter Kup [Gemmatimonadales bacterium]